jgi:cytoskeletal protein RodZ
MKGLGEILSEARKKKHISQSRAAADLLIKKEHIEALENQNWSDLPEPTFVKGFLKTYANYLSLDPVHVLAIYRREFDESKFQKPHRNPRAEKRLFLTPSRIINLIFILAIAIFIAYIVITFSSVLSAPKLEVISPSADETTSVPVVQIVGKADSEATVSIEGQFVPVDSQGNFSKEYPLSEGKNVIEVIAAKRLSPKAKITRTIRLIR